MIEWMDESMEEWIDGRTNELIRWMGEWVGLINGWRNPCTNGSMDEQIKTTVIHERMSGWMDT